MKFFKRLISLVAVLCAIGFILYKLDERYEETKYITIRKHNDTKPY